MWKLSDSQPRPARRRLFTRTWVAALTLGGVLASLTPSLTFACDDDYPAPTAWGQYPQQAPSVVVVEPRGGDRYEHWRRERAARYYWYMRGREHGREHRHHQRYWD